MTPVLLHLTLDTITYDCHSLFLLTRSPAAASSEGHYVSQAWLICRDVCPKCPLNNKSHPGLPFAFIDNQEGRLIFAFMAESASLLLPAGPESGHGRRS